MWQERIAALVSPAGMRERKKTMRLRRLACRPCGKPPPCGGGVVPTRVSDKNLRPSARLIAQTGFARAIYPVINAAARPATGVQPPHRRTAGRSPDVSHDLGDGPSANLFARAIGRGVYCRRPALPFPSALTGLKDGSGTMNSGHSSSQELDGRRQPASVMLSCAHLTMSCPPRG